MSKIIQAQGLSFVQGRLPFIKGHGTKNDFILIDDPDNECEVLTPEFIAQVCDRRAGIGADGLIRVVKAGAYPAWTGDPQLWFMDYYNSDGSTAEMCGNGARVFAHYVHVTGKEPEKSFSIVTRSGCKSVEIHGQPTPEQALVRIGMGPVACRGRSAVTVGTHSGGQETLASVMLDVGNPHCVCLVPEDLQRWDLATATIPAEDFPAGANLELVTVHGGSADTVIRASMRVLERGSGETLSCGSGAVAAAWEVLASRSSADVPVIGHVHMRVPGGDLEIIFTESDSYLVGPSTLVATGSLL